MTPMQDLRTRFGHMRSDVARLQTARLAPAQALALVVPAALVGCAAVLAVANASSRGIGLFFGIALVVASGMALFPAGRDSGDQPPPGPPGWSLIRHPLAVPLAMLFFGLVQPLIG